MGDMLLHLHQLNRIDSVIADSAKVHFASFCAKVQSVDKDKIMQFTREVRLDIFYSELLANNVNRKHLWTVVKLVLVLSHGNALVEGRFSVNKELLIENLLEETVVSQRLVYGAIIKAGMDVKKLHDNPNDCPCQAVACCVQKAGLLAKQQKENEEHLKVKDMRAEATEIDKQIAELESSK